MHILMIAPQPFFEPRGTPISIYDRIKALSDLGYLVDLVTYHIGQNKNLPGLTIFRSPTVPGINQIKIGPSFPKFFLDLLIFVTAFSLLTKKKYDVIHSHEEASYFSTLLSKLFKVPHIYDMHSRLPWQLRNSKYANWKPLIKIFDFLEKKTLLSCDAIITIGYDLEMYAKEVNPAVPNIQIDNLPLYTNFGISTSADIGAMKQKLNLGGKKTIVYTGTFESYQGLDLLLESALIAIQQNNQLVFILVGGTSNQVANYQKKVRDQGLEDHFRFTGTVSPVEAIKYLEIADILVSPRLGGMSVPLKIYTYLFSGKPILATDIPAHQLPNEAKIHLVQPSALEMADGLLDLLNHNEPIESSSLTKNRSEKLEALLEDYMSKVRSIYQSIQAATVNTAITVGVKKG
jgi:glycosyltransferase involved in cell wall biosynthesis